MASKCVVLMIDNLEWGLEAAGYFSDIVGEVIVCATIEEIPTKHLDLILYEPVVDRFTNKMFFAVKQQHPDTPIVCYTSIQNMQDHESLFEPNFDAIILKPISAEDFKKLCCSYLDRCISHEMLLASKGYMHNEEGAI